MAVAVPVPLPASLRIWPRMRRELVIFLAGLLAVIAVLGGAIRAGSSTGNPTVGLTASRVVTGTHQASFFVAGREGVYGFSGEVPWFDAQGVQHEGDWPACLPRLRDDIHGVRFGVVTVSSPDGAQSWQPVVWVDCRP